MFSFKADLNNGRYIYLDNSDTAIKQFDKRIGFGTRILCPPRFTDLARKFISIQGVCEKGFLWFKRDGDKGIIHFLSKEIAQMVLDAGILYALVEGIPYLDGPILSLKDTVINNIVNNSDQIKNAIHNNCENKNDNSYKSIYNALIDLGLNKDDAPALFEELMQRGKEEVLMEKVDYLQLQIQELKKSHEESLKIIIKQNQELLAILKNKSKNQFTDATNSSNEQKLSRSSPSMF